MSNDVLISEKYAEHDQQEERVEQEHHDDLDGVADDKDHEDHEDHEEPENHDDHEHHGDHEDSEDDENHDGHDDTADLHPQHQKDTDSDSITSESHAAEEAVEHPPLAPEKVSRILQGLLLAAGEPMTLMRLSKCFSAPKPPTDLLKSLLKMLEEEYADHDVLRLLQTASGYQFQLAPELSPWLLRLWEQKPPRYSRALLETLALIAYKQPITRGEIEQVRGVAVSNHIMKTLLDRGWITMVGQREVPGRPGLYGTTKEFLDYFSLKRLADLPELPEIAGILEEKYGAEADPPIQAQLPLDFTEEVIDTLEEEIQNVADAADEAILADEIVAIEDDLPTVSSTATDRSLDEADEDLVYESHLETEEVN